MVDPELLQLLGRIDQLDPRFAFRSHGDRYVSSQSARADLSNGFHLNVNHRFSCGIDISLSDDRYQIIYAATFNFDNRQDDAESAHHLRGWLQNKEIARNEEMKKQHAEWEAQREAAKRRFLLG